MLFKRKQPVRELYNELLTAFAATVSEWGKSKKNVFPKDKKQWIYSHICWKPIPSPVNPDKYPTDTAIVLGHEMGLKLNPSDNRLCTVADCQEEWHGEGGEWKETKETKEITSSK